MEPASKFVYRFGDIVVDGNRMEIHRAGVLVDLEPKVLRVLLLLIQHRDQVVTKAQLLRTVWNGTVVTENALTRAIVQLRKALGDDARQPLYVETVPTIGYRFAGILEEQVPETPIQIPVPADLPRRRLVLRSLPWIAASFLALLVCLVVVLRWKRTEPGPSPSMLSRVTNEAGLSKTPAVSRDGSLLAYSSDRNRDDGQDIYVRHVSGGDSVRVTLDGEENITPDFSPDGSKIIYRSSREGGGIYEVPTLGGTSQLIAREGLNPKYSPDGSQIAYWIGDERISLIHGKSNAYYSDNDAEPGRCHIVFRLASRSLARCSAVVAM